MKDYFLKYGVIMGKRFTPKQKMAFLNEIGSDLMNLGYKAEVITEKGKLKESHSLVIGEIDMAKIIFIAGYDTLSKALIPGYKYYPFNPKKNLQYETANLIVNLIFSLLLICILFFSALYFKGAGIFIKIVLAIIMLGIGFFMVTTTKGIANQVNYNRNSAGIVMIRALAEELKNNTNGAFILADETVSSYEGFKTISEKYGNLFENKMIVILDAIASGEELILAYREGIYEEGEKFLLSGEKNLQLRPLVFTDEKARNTALRFFNKGFYLVSGNMENQEAAVLYTRSSKDYVVDMERFENIKQWLGEYAKNL